MITTPFDQFDALNIDQNSTRYLPLAVSPDFQAIATDIDDGWTDLLQRRNEIDQVRIVGAAWDDSVAAARIVDGESFEKVTADATPTTGGCSSGRHRARS